MRKIEKWPDSGIMGANRANLDQIDRANLDWFTGTGKDESCYLEGTWWDMICLARNILASENTKLACPEFYHPEYHVDQYTGDQPYEYIGGREDK